MAMSARRPLPALAFLLALSLLTALVWWRVFSRTEADGTPAPRPTCAAQANQPLPAPNTVHITVLNGTAQGTARVGLAGTVSDALGADGFLMGTATDDTAVVSGVAEVRFGTAGTAAATLVSFYIPGSQLVPTPSITDATVTVSVGENFPQTGGVNNVDQANAAIAAASAAPSPGSSAKPC
jgi:hypothetical protein